MCDEANSVASGEEEEEYEIESIVDHQEKKFGKQLGFLVKWKGYGEEDNSWVSEEDAQNAKDIIVEYWRQVNAKKAKSAASTSVKRGRKSEPRPASEAPKKRGRQSKAASSDPPDAEEEPPVPKKQRKSKATSASAPVTSMDVDEDETESINEPVVKAMESKYHKMDSWEHLIQEIETVEKDPEGQDHLWIYVVLKDGKRVRETSTIAKQKFPNALIAYYESNLRWRST